MKLQNGGPGWLDRERGFISTAIIGEEARGLPLFENAQSCPVMVFLSVWVHTGRQGTPSKHPLTYALPLLHARGGEAILNYLRHS